MNHYERLNVTPDASAEVIRAAYRALATKLHPDRQGGNSGPNEEAHEAMAALNASYLILTNAKARADYDVRLKAELTQQQRSSFWPGKDKVQQAGAFDASRFTDDAFAQTAYEANHARGRAHAEADSSGANFSWMTGQAGLIDSLSKRADASPLPRWAWALLFSSVLTAGLMAWVMLQKNESQNFARSLSVASQEDNAGLSVPAKPKLPVISEAELSKLSNEELLARMPALIGESVLPPDPIEPTAAEVRSEPPLEAGRPLQLKQSMVLGSLIGTTEQP